MNTDRIDILYQRHHFDLDMDLLNPRMVHEMGSNVAHIIGSVKTGDHVEYKIQVAVGDCSWIVQKRYRDFYALHEELVVSHRLPWELLPPKKLIGNLNADHIEKRKVALNKYLKTILNVLLKLPTELIEFLEFDQFDVNCVCHKLARDLFQIGDSVIANNEVFRISPLQIHCINRRLLLPLPPCDTGDPTEDIGHLFSFVNQAKHIKIQSGEETFTTNEELTYDISIFKSLETLILSNCDIELLNGLESLQEQLWELKAIRCIKYLKDILVSSVCWDHGLLTAVEDADHCELAIDTATWKNIVLAAFTHNQLTSIDSTITLLPNIRKLDLSHNWLTDVQFLEGLLHLRDLDLSYNEITDVEDFPYKLGAISALNLAGNRLRDVKGLDKMYSLKRLKISDNLIEKMSNVLPLGNLPLLENIDLHGNPCTRENFYNVRLIAQFGDRYQEVTIDGIPTCKSDLAKAEEAIKLQNSYELITGPESYYFPSTLATTREAEIVRPMTPPRSPRLRSSRKHQHIVEIKPAPSSKKRIDQLTAVETEEGNFRNQVENLRQKAGESWLQFYNELHPDYIESVSVKTPCNTNDKQSHSESNVVKEESSTTEGKNSKPVNKVKPMQRNLEPTDKSDTKSGIKKVIFNIVREENNEKKIPGVVFNALEDMVDQNIDLFNETFLVFQQDEITATIDEHIVSYDREENSLVEIDLLSGNTVGHYNIDKIRNVRVMKKAGQICLYFDQEEDSEESSEKGVWTEKLLKFQEAKDCAGVFAILVGSTIGQGGEAKPASVESVEDEKAPVHAISPIDNPFLLKTEILLGFFQEFVRKTLSVKLGTEVKGLEVKNRDSFSALAYQNIGIGAPFLKHALPADGQQDVLLILWVGCIPYLFPEEELPICLVMTNINIFLFRVFLPEDSSPNALPKTVKEMKDIFHCFYSFSLKFIKEIVVGLYDQAFRIEVDDEGPRGTFTFLTRHSTKTAQFLEAYCSVIGHGEEKNSLDMRRRTSFISGDMISSITYPDESKIEALKSRLTAQDIYPIGDRENLISYCIVYMFVDSSDQDEFLYTSDIPVSTIKSLVLTNLRLFICDEDYVHFPPPSFAASSPTTPEWVVDDEKDVADLIGVDLWENSCHTYMLARVYGMTLTFDNPVTEFRESLSDENSSIISWKIVFGSMSERDQYVRSLSCLWKNQFSQDLTVTYSKLVTKPLVNDDDSVSDNSNLSPSKKGHSRVPSGNITLPLHKPIEQPDMLMALNPVRQKSYFSDNIAESEEEAKTGMTFITCSGCIPYAYPEKEIIVVLILSHARIYVVSSEADRHLINATRSIVDGSGGAPLCLASIDVEDLKQVVVGLFDQFIRIEGASRDKTFTFIIRDHEKTNKFMQKLSEVLLARKPDDSVRSNRSETTPTHIYKLYSKEDEESGAMAARSEFIHPNSDVKIVYPSDESLDKLKENVYDFISNSCTWHTERKFDILLYLLVFAETEDDILPCTFIVSETFACLMKEDYVNYPLPMFAKELPRMPQYKPADARLIASIIRIELQDLANGMFSIVFNRAGVEPSSYDQRFKTSSVEENFSLVTDLNTDLRVQEEQGALIWNLRAQSFNEREKIINIISKMWTSCYTGRTLPVAKRKNTRIGDVYQ